MDLQVIDQEHASAGPDECYRAKRIWNPDNWMVDPGGISRKHSIEYQECPGG